MKRAPAFSLVEVVLALGVVGFAIVAILGLVPAGLQTSRSSQEETRAAQLAQSVFASLAGGATQQFNNVQVQTSTGNESFDLGSSGDTTLWADNEGRLSSTATSPFLLTVTLNNSPPGFNGSGTANQVTVRVAWPAAAPAAQQSQREFIRIISKY